MIISIIKATAKTVALIDYSFGTDRCANPMETSFK